MPELSEFELVWLGGLPPQFECRRDGKRAFIWCPETGIHVGIAAEYIDGGGEQLKRLLEVAIQQLLFVHKHRAERHLL